MSDISEDYGYGINYESDEEHNRGLIEFQASQQYSLEKRVFALEQLMSDAMSVFNSVESQYLKFNNKYDEAKFHRFKGNSKIAKEKLSEYLSVLVSDKKYDEAIDTAKNFYYPRERGYYPDSSYAGWKYAEKHPVLVEAYVDKAEKLIERGKYFEYSQFVGSRDLFSTYKSLTPNQAFSRLSSFWKGVYKRLEPAFDKKYESLADSGKKKFEDYFDNMVEEVFFHKYKK